MGTETSPKMGCIPIFVDNKISFARFIDSEAAAGRDRKYCLEKINKITVIKRWKL